MGCDFSLTNDLQFSTGQNQEIFSISKVLQIHYDKFSVHFQKVRRLCENKNYLQAQQIGDKFFSKHLVFQAIEIYQYIIENNPSYGLQQFQGFGNMEMAMSYYSQNVWKFYDNIHSTNKSVHDSLSLCYMILSYGPKQYVRQLSKGQVWYKKMIQKQPKNMGLLIGFGNFLYNQDKVDLALEYYERAIQVYDKFVNIYVIKAMIYGFNKSEKNESGKLSKKVFEMVSNNKYVELILATHIQNVDQRIQKLEQLHKKYPQYIRILNEQGSDYLQCKKDYVKARQCFEKCIKINPIYNKGYNNIGAAYKQQQDYPNAIINYFKSIQINKRFDGSYYGCMFGFQKMNFSFEDIIKELEKYPKIKKDWFWMKLGQKIDVYQPTNTDKSIQYYNKSIQINPNFHLAYEMLGKAYIKKEMNKQAMQSLKKCIQLSPEYYTAYFQLAVLYSHEGYQEESIKMYQKTIQINPRYAYAYQNLGNIYSSKQNYEKAQQYYKNAVKFDSKDSLLWTSLGICHLNQKQYKQAHNAFTKAKFYLEATKKIWNKARIQFIQDTLKNVDIDGQKWKVYLKTGSISENQSNHLHGLMQQFSNKLKIHQKINPDIRMPLQRVMRPQAMQISKIIYQNKFRLYGILNVFKQVMKLYCQVDEDYFHIVPLYIVQYFLLSVYELKRGPQDVQNQTQQMMKKLAAMVGQKQKQVNDGQSAENKEKKASASPQKTNIKVQLTQCEPLNKQINLFSEAAYFNTYQDLYAEIDKANNAAKPYFNDFALLVQQVRNKANGIPGGISMKIPSKSEDQFKVIMRIMQKMFKKQINPERIRKIIFNIEARIVNANYGNVDEILLQIVGSWTDQIGKILKERRQQKIETECCISDLIRAKCTFNTFEDLLNAVKVADFYCKNHGYQIVQVDNRLNKIQTKDVVLKIKIKQAVCQFQLAMPQSAKLFHLDHCVYEIIRSPLGCIFGSYLFISKSVKYPFVKNCQDMFQQLCKSKDMMDKINKMYPQYVMNALTKDWKMNKG